MADNKIDQNPHTTATKSKEQKRDPKRTRPIRIFKIFPELELMGKETEITPDMMEIVCARFRKYVEEHPTSINIEDFFNDHRIPKWKVKLWRQRYTRFNEEYEDLCMLLGSDRETMMQRRELPETSTMKAMPYYSPTWKEGAEWQSLLAEIKNLKEDVKLLYEEIKPK